VKLLVVAALVLAGPPAIAAEPATTANRISVVVPTPGTPADARDVAAGRQIDEADELIAAKRAAEALPILDRVLADYAERFPAGSTRWYVARTDDESAYYLGLSLLLGPDDGKQEASILRNGWSYAWYRKGYALLELGRVAEARAALDAGLALSPSNSTLLMERAEVSKLERDWNAAMELFVAAEDASRFNPASEQVREKAQAMRGQAFVHIERGDLDAAEKVLKACLKLDPNDARAKDELAYIGKLRKP
jgi:tetratricopeptide (TPR) repeat protein